MKIVLFANTDWYLFNFRLSLATALREDGHEVVLVSPEGTYGDKLRALGFRWIPAPMKRRSLNPLREAALVLWLHVLLAREKADLVHGFTIKCAVYGSLAGRFAGTSRVNSIAGMGYVFTSRDWLARFLRPVVRSLVRWALDGPTSRVILQNPDDVALFEQARLVNMARVRLIAGSGVNCERFTPGPEMQAAESFRVLLPARLLWDKGIGEFIAAARRLRGEGRSIEFLLAGDPDPGNPAAVSKRELDQWTAEGIVTWLGHVNDMPSLFRSVGAVVLPSYREGLPKGLIEAGACSLPLVTCDAPGCREVVRDGVEGLLVPIGDAAGLAQAIARLHDDPGLRLRLGRAARARVLSEFDEHIVIAKTVGVYRELIADQGPSAPA